MAIFKCKMCSHYDGEWCHKEKIIKTRRSPCDSCRECRIKINEKMSFYPYAQFLPDWLVWLLARLAFSIVTIMTFFVAFFAVYFTGAAISSMLTWSTPLVKYDLGSATICLFLTMLGKSCATWLHNKYF